MDYNGIYVGKKDRDFIKSRILSLGDKFNRRGMDYKQQRALFRDYCRDVLSLFDECFETSMLGMSRCVRRVRDYQRDDNVCVERASLDITNVLMWLLGVVEKMIPLEELPSCKQLTDFSAEDIIAKAKNLVESDVVKAGIGAALLGVKVGEVIRIEDVRRYYEGLLSELRNEIDEKGENPSPVELFLLDKFDAEIGYCDLAMWKVGTGAAEEITGLVEIGRRNIEKYERRLNEGVGIWTVRT